MDLHHGEFAVEPGTTYLNSCSHGLLPARSRRALDAHLDAWARAPDWGAWMDTVEKARADFARLIHARGPEDVAVVSSASEGISMVLSSLRPTSARDRIVTTALDFPAAPTLAHHATERGFKHAHVAGVPSKNDIDSRTALVCTPVVASFSGRRMDVRGLAQAAHDAGGLLLADAFQAAGNVEIDVRALDVDFLVTGVYKWLLGPPGFGFVYVKSEHHARVPTRSGWQGHAEPYAFDPMGPLAPDARRYQGGGPNVAGAVGTSASLSLLQEVGVPAIARHNEALVDQVLDAAAARKWEILTPRDARASIVTFRVPHLERALAALARERVIVNSRSGGIRVSPHLYNDAADIERLFRVLDAA